MPRKVRKSTCLVEGSILLIPSTLFGSGLSTLELRMWQKNGISVHPILHLSALLSRFHHVQ